MCACAGNGPFIRCALENGAQRVARFVVGEGVFRLSKSAPTLYTVSNLALEICWRVTAIYIDMAMHGCSECTERDHIWSGVGIVPCLGPCVLRDSFVLSLVRPTPLSPSSVPPQSGLGLGRQEHVGTLLQRPIQPLLRPRDWGPTTHALTQGRRERP